MSLLNVLESDRGETDLQSGLASRVHVPVELPSPPSSSRTPRGLPELDSAFATERDPEEQEWITVARGVARQLSQTVTERYRERKKPTAEQDLLREAGLTTLLVPKEFGGAGVSWNAAEQVVREIAAGDGSLGVLLVHHTFGVAGLHGQPEPRRSALFTETVRRNLWFGVVVNPRDADITATPIGNGRFLLNGRKTFCTGAALADKLAIHIRRTDTGIAQFALVESNRPGIRAGNDWDAIGLPLAESGSFTLESVEVTEEEITATGFGPKEATGRTVIPSGHLMFNNVYLGIALGALRAARDYIHTTTRPWIHSPAAHAHDDPLIVQEFAELWAQLEAAIVLSDRASEITKNAHSIPEHLFSEELRGRWAVAIATAKVAGARASVHITSKIFELMGARSTAAKYGFDRFWRDARTYTLHHPLFYKVREIGEYALNHRFPAQDYYS